MSFGRKTKSKMCALWSSIAKGVLKTISEYIQKSIEAEDPTEMTA